MRNPVVVRRVITNILITLASIGWVFPLASGIHGALVWLYRSNQPDYHEETDCCFFLQLGELYPNIGLLWLGIVIVFWAFVAANKLRPVEAKE